MIPLLSFSTSFLEASGAGIAEEVPAAEPVAGLEAEIETAFATSVVLHPNDYA